MAAMTVDVIVDRVRSVCARPPFSLKEATTWVDFETTPDQAVDGAFRIMPPSSQRVIGGFSYVEDRTDSLQLWVARKHNQKYDVVRRVLLRDIHSLTSAVVRDAHGVSGDYAIPDSGRGHAIVAPPGKDFVVLRLTLPVNFEAQL